MKRFRAVWLWPAAVAATALVAALPARAPGQQPDKPPPAKQEIQVYPIKHVAATELAASLQQVLGDGGGRGQVGRNVRVGVEARTNAIIVMTSPGEMENIDKLIKALDVEPPERMDEGRKLVQLVTLKNVRPDDDLEKMLRVVYQGTEGFALDMQRRMVVLTGDKATRDAARLLIEHIDATPPAPPRVEAGEMQVRVVWLVSGLEDPEGDPKRAAKTPADLGDVVAELGKLGIDKPRMAAQAIVNAQFQGTFQVEGTAELHQPCVFSVVGMLTERKAAAGLEIEIKATRESVPVPGGFGGPRGKPASICNLRTQISAPLGHAVVLGVTPTEGMTSVFVVQVLQKEVKGPPRR